MVIEFTENIESPLLLKYNIHNIDLLLRIVFLGIKQ
jgi:hypothetical protein